MESTCNGVLFDFLVFYVNLRKVPNDSFIYFLASFPKKIRVVVTRFAKKKNRHRGNITIAGEKLQNVGNIYPLTSDMMRGLVFLQYHTNKGDK